MKTRSADTADIFSSLELGKENGCNVLGLLEGVEEPNHPRGGLERRPGDQRDGARGGAVKGLFTNFVDNRSGHIACPPTLRGHTMAIGSATSTTSTLAADQAADKLATTAATKAAAALTADQKAKASADTIKTDEANVKATEAAQKQADAKVQADASASGGVNIKV